MDCLMPYNTPQPCRAGCTTVQGWVHNCTGLGARPYRAGCTTLSLKRIRQPLGIFIHLTIHSNDLNHQRQTLTFT